MRLQIQVSLLLDTLRDLSCMAAALGERAIQIDHAVATGFISGIHGIEGVIVDGSRTPRDHAPGPQLKILGSDGRADGRAMNSVTALQFSHIESAARPS